MSTAPGDRNMSEETYCRPRRQRADSNRSSARSDPNDKSLELDGVLKILGTYTDDQYSGGVNCCICGKLYRSRVCLIKHLWEHSIYWDMFDCEKNHERVLSIQAALILYCPHHKERTSLPSLLVTSPHEKKKETEASSPDKQSAKDRVKTKAAKRKILSEINKSDKRKRCTSEDSGVSSGSSDSENTAK